MTDLQFINISLTLTRVFILTLLSFLLFSVSVFADDVLINEDSPLDSSSGVSSPLSADLDQQELYSFAEGLAAEMVSQNVITAAAATDYTQLIYNLLVTNFNSSNSGTFSNYLYTLKSIFVGGNGYVANVPTMGLYELIMKMYIQLVENSTGGGYSSTTLRGMIMLMADYILGYPDDNPDFALSLPGQLTQLYNIEVGSNYQLSLIKSDTANLLSSVQSLNSISWQTVSSSNFEFFGTSLTLEGEYDTVNKSGNDLFVKVRFGTLNSASIYSIVDAWYSQPNTFEHTSVDFYYHSNLSDSPVLLDDIYCFVMSNRLIFSSLPEVFKNRYIILHFHNDDIVCVYNNKYTPSLQYISGTDYRGWGLRQNFSVFHIEQLLNNLNSELAPTDITAAREASKEVINDTLDNFTGSGSAAVKKSDSSALKDVSSGLRSGLNADGSVSYALSVFDTSSDFWSWFSSSVFSEVNGSSRSRSLRSAPRSVSDDGWDIIDANSFNQNELNNLIRGD